MLPYDTGKFHGIPVGADSISARPQAFPLVWKVAPLQNV